MTSKNAWAVRPYPHMIYRAEQFKKNSMAAIGWPDLGDLAECDREKIREKYAEHYPDENAHAAGQRVGVIDRFVNQIQEGDIVAIPDGGNVLFGTAKGKYSFHKEFSGEDEGYPHWIGVEYAVEVLRKDLAAKLQTALKGWMTVFGIPYELARYAMDNLGKREEADIAKENAELKEAYVEKLLQGGIPGANETQIEEAVKVLLSDSFPGLDRLDPENTSTRADADLWTELPGNLVVRIQIKCDQADRGELGMAAVKQLHRSMLAGDTGIIVTTNKASRQARKFAAESAKKPVGIIDAHEFAELVFKKIDEWSDEDLRLFGLTRSYKFR